jgi:Fe(3+) dicitrate transport protein
VVHNTLPISFVAYHSAYNRLLGSDAASSGGSGTGELFNGGAAQVTGLEFQYAKSFKALTATATGTYTRAIFTESFASEFDGWGDVEAGDVLPYLPAFQANLALDYQHKKWNASAGINGLGARKSSASLDEYDLPAAVVANAALRYDITEKWSLKLSGQNLTNTRHIVAARPAGFRTFTPRMWTVGAELGL